LVFELFIDLPVPTKAAGKAFTPESKMPPTNELSSVGEINSYSFVSLPSTWF